MLETLAAGLFPKEGPLDSWSSEDRMQSLLLKPAGRCNLPLGVPFGRPARLIMSELLERVHCASGRILCLDGDFFAALISVMQSYYTAGRFANWSMLACEEVVRFFDTAYAVRQRLGHSTLQNSGEFAAAYRWRYAGDAARAAGEAEAFEVELTPAFHRALQGYQRSTQAPVVRQLLCNPGDAVLTHDLYVLLADTQAAGVAQHMPLHVLQQGICGGAYMGMAPGEFSAIIADAVGRIGALDPQVVEAVNLTSFLLTVAASSRPGPAAAAVVPAAAVAPVGPIPAVEIAEPLLAPVASSPRVEEAMVEESEAAAGFEWTLGEEAGEVMGAEVMGAEAAEVVVAEAEEVMTGAAENASDWALGSAADAVRCGDWAFGPAAPAAPVAAAEEWSMGQVTETSQTEDEPIELDEELVELSRPPADLAAASPLFSLAPASEAMGRFVAQRQQMREQPSFAGRLERSWPRAVELVAALARYGAKNILQPGSAIEALNALMVYSGDFLDRLPAATPLHLQPLMLQIDLMMEEGAQRGRTFPLTPPRLTGRLPEAELLYRNLVPAEATRRAEGALGLAKQAMSRVFGSLDPHPNIPQMDQIYASALAAGVLLARFAGSIEEAERLRHMLFLELRAALGATTAGLAAMATCGTEQDRHDVGGGFL